MCAEGNTSTPQHNTSFHACFRHNGPVTSNCVIGCWAHWDYIFTQILADTDETVLAEPVGATR